MKSVPWSAVGRLSPGPQPFWLKCSICGDWLIHGAESPREVEAWVLFLFHLGRGVFQNVSSLGFVECCTAKFRDVPQWACQGKCCTQNFMSRATCRECGRDVPNGLKKKQLEALVEKDERDSRRMRND